MKRIALYGYGVFGKRTSESFKLYWGTEFTITAIFDKELAGETDRFWNLRVLSPKQIKKEYKKGTYDAVMVCIFDNEIRASINRKLTELGIPVFVPGKSEDFAGPDAFQEDNTPGFSICRDKYSFHVYTNMLGAVADCERYQFLFLFNEDGKVNIDNYKKYKEDFEQILLFYPFRLKNPIPDRVYMSGCYCIIAKAYSVNYWHFTFDMADCVYLLETAGYKGKYIYNEKPCSKELLLIMGISQDRLISTKELETHKVYVFEKLFDVNHREMDNSGYYSMEVLSEMANSIKKKLRKRENSPKRIYVTRTGRRKLLNGEKLAANNGFSIIIPEEYTVREQMELFYNADIVICPHGANSTNCLYMRKGSVFSEIFSDRWHMVINADICETNGVHYLQMVGKASSINQNGIDEDYTVDEESFQLLIQKAEKIIAHEKAG